MLKDVAISCRDVITQNRLKGYWVGIYIFYHSPTPEFHPVPCSTHLKFVGSILYTMHWAIC